MFALNELRRVGGNERFMSVAPSRCAVCSCELSPENDSSEHVIPNAIGGRLKVRGFICADCNSSKGAEWDAALAKRLNGLCVVLGVKRERGSVPDEPIELASGRELRLRANGEMTLRHPIVDNPGQPVPGETLTVRVQARSVEEARRISRELEAHYAEQGGRLENIIVEDNYTYDIDPTQFQASIGGEGASHSIVKTALAFAHHCGVSWEKCEQAQKSFRGEIDPCFGFYSQPEDVIVREHASPCHYLVLRGCPVAGQLLCYVEFFSLHKMIVCLSTDYTGDDITHTYGIDPTSGEAVDVCVGFDFGSISIEKLYAYELLDTDLVEEAMGRIAPFIMRRSHGLALRNAIERAVERAQERTREEMGDEYEEGTLDYRYVFEELQPFLLHMIRLRRAGPPSTLCPQRPHPES